MRIDGNDLKLREFPQISSYPKVSPLLKRDRNGVLYQTYGPYDKCCGQQVLMTTGWDIPKFHTRLKAGELLPHTPFEKIAINSYLMTAECDWTYFDGSYTYRWYYDPPGTRFESTKWQITPTELQTLAAGDYSKYVTNAAAKLYSDGFDALTWLAELKDVRRLWESISDKLLHLKVPKNLRGLSSSWLEYRYGWRQLVNDFKNLNEACAKLKDKRARHSARTGTRQSSSTSTPTSTPGQYYDTMEIVTDTVEVSARGCVTADVEVPTFQFNLLQTAWEIIPYSFVIDWFVNVGKTLSAISFLLNVRQYSASWGVRVSLDRSYSMHYYNPKAGFLYGSFSQDSACKGEIEVRTPSAIPYFPHFVLNMDKSKILDSISLIVQRLK